MTTIAWDGKLLCADSRTVGGYITQKQIKKVFVFESERYVAIAACGSTGCVNAMIEWALGHADKPNFESGSCVGLIAIDHDGQAWEYDSSVFDRTECGSIEANGSGSDYAMGAMLAGASAFRAVEIAAQLDVNTGGQVQCFDFATKTLTGPEFKLHSLKICAT